MIPKILRLPDVLSATGLSRSTIYSYIQQGIWIKPIHLGPRTAGWPANEVTALLLARIAGQSDKEISLLVKKLEGERKNAS